MNRSHSLQLLLPCSATFGQNHGFIQAKSYKSPIPIHSSKSLPNIDTILNDQRNLKKDVGIKRQNSKRVKILQKTWDKVKTIIHPSSARRNSKAKTSNVEPDLSPRTVSPITKHAKSKQTIITNANSSSAPSTPNKKLVFDFNFDHTAGSNQHSYHHSTDQYYNSYSTNTNNKSRLENDEEEDQVVKNYVELQKRLSDELHQAIMNKDERKKDETLSEEFKKRLQQWDMWKVSTGKYHYTEEELKQLIPSDFSKKLQEWEYIKTRPRDEVVDLSALSGAGASGPPGYLDAGAQGSSGCSKKTQRKKKNTEVSRQKELAWLEKQLDKIECEKKRLEREMKKYCERELRLEKMREALKNSPGPKQEVWIKTPTAECKVEGINEKFTKKLYKWEEKQGIQPESSTMALLNPKYYTPYPDQQQLSDNVELNLPEITSSDHEDGNDSHHHHHQLSKTDYTSSDESEPDEEYEEATDSFATKDESRASGASNTDSECFNLKPAGFRRRSSDAISTPLSAQSPSLSGCTSDDEENYMLKTVNENEEDKMVPEERPIFRAKPIVMDDDDEGMDNNEISNAIVPTKRTIFTPVVDYHDDDGDESEDNKLAIIENLMSPTLIKNIVDKFSLPSPSSNSGASASSPRVVHETWKKVDVSPKIVGVIRKCSDASTISAVSCASTRQIPNSGNKYSNPPPHSPTIEIPSTASPPRPNFPKMGGRIPVWCSPLMARRRVFPVQSDRQNSLEEKFAPNTDFSLDKFLEVSNLYLPSTPPTPNNNTFVLSPLTSPSTSTNPPTAPSRTSRIPITSPCLLRRKYTIGGEFPPEHEENGSVRLVSLTRSCSFQGATKRQQQAHALQLQMQSQQQQYESLKNSDVVPPPPQPLKQPLSLSARPPISVSSTVDSSKVAKSKSTGSILGSSNSTKGLFGFASKFGLASSGGNASTSTSTATHKSEQKSKILPAWLRHSSSSSHAAKK